MSSYPHVEPGFGLRSCISLVTGSSGSFPLQSQLLHHIDHLHLLLHHLQRKLWLNHHFLPF